jgi:hypothetical protein
MIVDRLLYGPAEIRKCLPSILSSDKMSYITLLSNGYFLLAFLSEHDEQRVKSLVDRNFDPFPGLIKPNNVHDVPAAIRVASASRNRYFKSNTVTNMYSFSAGKDTTFMLENHTQSIQIKGLGFQDYTVALAYLIVFGNEINKENFHGYLEDLISFSIRHWRVDHES